MKKITIQALIDIILITLFIIFVLIVNKNNFFENNQIWVKIIVFLSIVSLICLSKYILYRRQNFLYFFLVFVSYLIVVSLFSFDIFVLLQKKFGFFVLLPGIIAVMFYLRYREVYQLRFGVVLSFLGTILLLLFM